MRSNTWHLGAAIVMGLLSTIGCSDDESSSSGNNGDLTTSGSGGSDQNLVTGGTGETAGTGGNSTAGQSGAAAQGGNAPNTGGATAIDSGLRADGSAPNPLCGNGTIDNGEQCDCGADNSCTPAELGGATCSSLEKGTGTLGCNTQCSFDSSGCDSSSATDSGTAGSEATDSTVIDLPCDPADQTPPPTAVPFRGLGAPPTGPYPVTIEHDPGLDSHTVYRPELGEVKHPIVAWANGGCMRDGLMFDEFLVELASHGFLIISNGPPNGTGMEPGGLTTNGVPQTQAIDWAVQENERPCSQYYHKLDATKIAAMGQSCGGLMTFGVSGDPRLTTVVIWNSGMFERDQAIYDGLHTPLAFFIGGSTDVAFPQAEADFAAINRPDIPIFYGNFNVGHMGTYGQDNGGEFARVGIAWLKWQLMDDQGPTGKEMFVGANCGLCNTEWIIQKKNME